MTEPPSPFAPPQASLELPPSPPPTAGAIRTEMAYLDAYQSFFKSPRWGMNLLLLGVCVLVPLVGLIVIQGYMATIVARRHALGEVLHRDFDFKLFGPYLERGVWPFLASLIASFATMPILGVTVAMIVVAIESENEQAIVAAGTAAAVIFVAFMIAMLLVMRGILIRAFFLQNLTGVFSLSFVGDFAKRMWLELFLTQLFLFFTSLPLVLLGYLFCGLGIYPAIALTTYASIQLDLQLYEVHLSRGGTPIKIDPRLLA